MRRSARCGILTAGLLVVASSSARADDRATREAEARFAEGLSRVKKQDYEAARLSFVQAYTVLHRPLILWNLALSEEKSGHPLDALEHFRQVSHEGLSEADRASAQRHVDGLLAQVGRIDVQAPAGSTFVLDGVDVTGTAPLDEPLDVVPGRHVVDARLPAGTSKRSEVDAVAGQVAHVAFAADVPVAAPVAAPVPPAPPVETQALPPPPPEPAEAHHPFWTARTTTTVVLGGMAVVAVGFAAGFGVASMNASSDATNFYNKYGRSGCFGTMAPSICGQWNDDVNAQNRNAVISNALYFTAGALAVGAAVSWFFWPKGSQGASAWVAPEVAPGTAGVGAGGSF